MALQGVQLLVPGGHLVAISKKVKYMIIITIVIIVVNIVQK